MIIITCNTTHFFYARLQSSVKVPILNLIDETAKAAGRAGMKNAAVLSSRTTRDLDLYGAPLGKLPEQVQSPIQELSYKEKPSSSTEKTEVASGVPQFEA